MAKKAISKYPGRAHGLVHGASVGAGAGGNGTN